MPRIQFPNVPNDPGVPQLLRKLPAGPPQILASAAGLASLIRAFTATNVWGVFAHHDPAPASSAPASSSSDGSVLAPVVVTARRSPVLKPDSYLDFEYNQEWNVSTAPTQRGGFADYNRVANPFEIKLRMFKGGELTERKLFLQQIEDLSTTALYDVVTPERTYPRCNFIRAEVSRRGEKGAYQLSMVDVYFREIREVTAAYEKTVISSPTDTSAAQKQNNGTQQGVSSIAEPPPSVTR